MKKPIILLLAIVLALAAAAAAESDYTYYPESEAYAGAWYADDCVLEIAHMDEDYNLFSCVVTQYDGEGEGTRWVYDGCAYDDVGRALSSLETGDKFRVRFDGSGDLSDPGAVFFTDGAAAFALNDDGTLTWTDCKEMPGENERTFEKTDDLADYSLATPLDRGLVEGFAARVRNAYLRADWSALALLVDYPITLPDGQEAGAPAEFEAHMSGKAPTDVDAADMEAEDCRDLFVNWRGICMGNGQIWLGDANPDGAGQSGEPLLRVIGINGVE